MELEIIYKNVIYKEIVYTFYTFSILVKKILLIINAPPENLSLWLGNKVIGFDISLNLFLEQQKEDFVTNNNRIIIKEEFDPLSYQKIQFLLSLNEQINLIHNSILKKQSIKLPFWNKYQSCPINGRYLGSYKDKITKENFSLDVLDNSFNNLVSIIKNNKRVILNKYALKQFLEEKKCMPTILSNLNTIDKIYVVEKLNSFNNFIFIDLNCYSSIELSNKLVNKIVPVNERTFLFLKFEELKNDIIINETIICTTKDKLFDYIYEKTPKFKPIIEQSLKNKYNNNKLLEILGDGIFSNGTLYRFKQIKMDFFS